MIPAGRVLGFDLGERRIGVAVTDSSQAVAMAAATITRSGDEAADHGAMAGLVDEYEAVGVVVGLPLSLSGKPGPSAERVLEEVERLRVSLGVQVEMVDERFTTTVAASGLRASGRPARRQRNFIDAAAAAELLQTWLARRSATVGEV